MKNVRSGQAAEGVRARNRRETLKRIADNAIRLFIEKGYEGTTLEDIAGAAGISRRTFFYYFKSKDEILLSMQSGMGDTLATALLRQPPHKRPMEAVRDAVVEASASYPARDMIAIDRLMRSSEAVQARKQASYIQHENTLFTALRQRWPDPERETALRVVAMLSIGAVRLSLEKLGQEDGRRPISDLLRETFDALESEV